jgi:hypothetical protein
VLVFGAGVSVPVDGGVTAVGGVVVPADEPPPPQDTRAAGSSRTQREALNFMFGLMNYVDIG